MELNLREQYASSSCLPEGNESSLKIGLHTDNSAITKAVIIAAGKGSRLEGYKNGTPKPLVEVGGMPLIKRVILAAKKIGVTEFVIVLGYQAAKIRRAINAQKLGVKITWVRNSDWEKPNGLSVLKAEKYVDGRFLLFMADHVFDPNILQDLMKLDISKHCGVLCVDRRLNKVINLDDATKVRTHDNQMMDIGKSLTDFNAIDVGIFVCTPHIFEALRQSQLKGDDTLSGGIRELAREGRMWTLDIGDRFWQDVDTLPDLRQAERLLLRATRSDRDGIVAKLINRRISNGITRWLIKTPITPNQISILNLIFSVFIAWIVSFGKPLTTALGGILFQLASILDGCDGEVAQIKLKESKLGALVDTISDHLSYFLFVAGVTVGMFNATGNPLVFVVTAISLLFLLVALRIGVSYLNKQGSRSLRDLDQDIASLNHAGQDVWYLRAFGLAHHLGRRDTFSFMTLLVMLWGNIALFYWMMIGAVNLIGVGIAISAAALLAQRYDLHVLAPFKKLFSFSSNGYEKPGFQLQPEKELTK